MAALMLTKLKQYWQLLFYGRFGEQFRFLAAGGVNTVVGYGLFALGYWLLNPLFAPLAGAGSASMGSASHSGLSVWIGQHSYAVIQWITWVCSVPFGAFTLKYFAFQSPGPYLPQAARSYLVYLPAQLVSNLLLILFVSRFHLHPLVAQLLTICIATVISYLGHKFFTFRKPD
jgi:putative flippase GtrA